MGRPLRLHRVTCRSSDSCTRECGASTGVQNIRRLQLPLGPATGPASGTGSGLTRETPLQAAVVLFVLLVESGRQRHERSCFLPRAPSWLGCAPHAFAQGYPPARKNPVLQTQCHDLLQFCGHPCRLLVHIPNPSRFDTEDRAERPEAVFAPGIRFGRLRLLISRDYCTG